MKLWLRAQWPDELEEEDFERQRQLLPVPSRGLQTRNRNAVFKR